jgi:hypothetical protein
MSQMLVLPVTSRTRSSLQGWHVVLKPLLGAASFLPMVFSSTLFLFYFLPLFLLVYGFVPQQAKNPVALVAIVLFYAWGGLDFLGLFLGSVIINFKQHQASH